MPLFHSLHNHHVYFNALLNSFCMQTDQRYCRTFFKLKMALTQDLREAKQHGQVRNRPSRSGRRAFQDIASRGVQEDFIVPNSMRKLAKDPSIFNRTCLDSLR